MFDILIKNGLIADGSGRAAYKADLAIKDGKISRIAPKITEQAGRIIDAAGLVVAPGFIDCHNHSDMTILAGSDCYNYLEQGVTTQVTGHCGDSAAPYYDGGLLRLKSTVSSGEFTRITQAAATPASFMEAMEDISTGCNTAFFVGHNNIRAGVMGFSPNEPDAGEMKAMQEGIVRAMEAGFLGYSSGLIYAPSVYGDTRELTELARAMAPYNGIYTSHIRGEGNHVVDAVKEAIQVGEDAGVPVLISHLKVIGIHNEGTSHTLLQLIDQANERGVTVYADQYPFNASSASLRTRIPPKYHVGGLQAFMERLRDPAVRQKILYSIFHEPEEFESCLYASGFDGAMISTAPKTPQYQNRTLGQIARDEGKAPIDVLCDVILQNDGIAQGIYFNQNATDMLRILAHPLVFGGSDNSNYPDERLDPQTPGGRHPRGTATMVRRLELQRDFRLCSMEESVRRVTSAPAQALQLHDQGLLLEGRDANITVFDYENLHARASYTYPCRENVGISYVLVNGRVAVENGRCTKVRAGKVLKRRA